MTRTWRKTICEDGFAFECTCPVSITNSCIVLLTPTRAITVNTTLKKYRKAYEEKGIEVLSGLTAEQIVPSGLSYHAADRTYAADGTFDPFLIWNTIDGFERLYTLDVVTEKDLEGIDVDALVNYLYQLDKEYWLDLEALAPALMKYLYENELLIRWF